MVDRLEAMLARWPVLTFLVIAACSVGGTATTIAFLNSELTSARIEVALARSEAHDARIRQDLMGKEIDALNRKIDRLEGNAMFGRDKPRDKMP